MDKLDIKSECFDMKGAEKTWVNFTHLSDNVENQKFPLPSHYREQYAHTDLFTGPLSNLNMVDKYDRDFIILSKRMDMTGVRIYKGSRKD